MVMRRQTARFSTGPYSGQRCTSSKLRPQPLQTESPWLVEQIAMQGASGVLSYQASQACLARAGIVGSSHSGSRPYTISAYTSASARTSGQAVMPSGEGERLRHQLMAASMSVMWMPAMGAGRDRVASGLGVCTQRLRRSRPRVNRPRARGFVIASPGETPAPVEGGVTTPTA